MRKKQSKNILDKNLENLNEAMKEYKENLKNVGKNDSDYIKSERGELFKYNILVKKEHGKFYIECGQSCYGSAWRTFSRNELLDDNIDNLKKLREYLVKNLNYELDKFEMILKSEEIKKEIKYLGLNPINQILEIIKKGF